MPTKPPPRALPLWYFGAGHLCLCGAFLTAALDPAAVASTFLLPRTVAVLHLITLGWITTSILGATYVVGPLALKVPIRATRVDGWACAGVLLGALGVIAHFWINGYSGVVWSGGLLLAAFGVVVWRVLAALAKAPGTPAAIRAHVALAYLNLLLATGLGTLLAYDKAHAILPGGHLNALFAHAHLAVVGWATMMVVGVGYRLLPMFLPAAPPCPALCWVSAAALEIGVLGLTASLMLAPAAAPLFAGVLALGFAAFFLAIGRMLQNRRPPPAALRRPDLGMLQTLQALCYLLASIGVGFYLVSSAGLHPAWIAVYGVCAVIGFLAQIVLGVGQRLFPVFAWTEAWSGSEFKELPQSPHAMPARHLQLAQLGTWTAGVPLLAIGVGTGDPSLTSIGAWLLFAGTLFAAVNTARIARHAFPRTHPRTP